MRKRIIQQQIRRLVGNLWKSARSVIASGPPRRYRAWLFQAYVLIALLAFSALAVAASAFTYMDIDLEVTRELQEELPPWTLGIMQAVSWPGYEIGAIVTVAAITVLLALFGLRWEALVALIAAIGSGALNFLIKAAIQRPRPSPDLVSVIHELTSYSFPSGHVMFYTAFFGFLLFLAFILLKNSWWRSLLMLVFTALIALVGLSRMYLGEHWASDVLGGYLMGSLCLILVIQFYRIGKGRFSQGQPVAPSGRGEQDEPIPDPYIIPGGDKTNDHHPDRAPTRSPFEGKAQSYSVPETGSQHRRDRTGRGN